MKKLLSFFLGFFLLTAAPSYAAFNVSVTPYEGGFNLDFGKVGFTPENAVKEVSVRIDSTIAKQYRLLQTLMEPLISTQGDAIGPGAFVVSSTRGSSRSGTLLTDFEVPVTMNRTPLYVSDQQGNPDSFTLVYALKGFGSVPSGSYRGRLRFTLEAVDSSLQQVEVYLTVLAEIENNEASISVSTPTGAKTISVKIAKTGVETGDVIFSMKNPPRNAAGRIIQVFSGAPTSSDGSELPLEAILVQAGDSPAVPVASERQTILSALPQKEGDTVIRYGLSEGALKAGLYRSTVRYILEGGKTPAELGSFSFEANVEKIFDLQMTTESGGGIITFRDLKPNQPARNFEVSVTVKNNTGKRFQVTQKVLSDLANKAGQSIPGENFTVMMEKSPETKGTLKIPAKTAMRIGEQVLFLSDNAGTPGTFKIIYGLSTPDSVKAGDYSASVVYSLSEI